jgi:hypothetical protein
MNAGLLVLALLLGAITPSPVQAKPEPGYKPGAGFRLFARASFRWIGNRTQCFLSASGQICTAESSTVGGGYWPASTANQYIFNSGLQVAGIVDSASVGNSWAGDIEGAFFFNARGGGNGQQITTIYNSADPADLSAWPAGAYVPSGTDLSASLYAAPLQGQKTASDNDIWFLSWEGDPNLASGRGHPLGLLVETRGLAYTTPGKNDMLFFIYTFYNVSASDPAVYNSAPARLQPDLRAAGARFQQLNTAKGAVLPAGGYTIKNMFLAFGADMDVTFNGSGSNFDGVNVPFALGYTYHSTFTSDPAWTFSDATIYTAPFFKGAGFIGVKYLKSPEVNGQQVGLTLFGATTNGGEFSDPRNTQALYRYLTGHPDPSQGDDQCNVGDVAVTKICYMNQGAPADMRFFQSSGPLTLGPGEYSSIAVAYIYAAPVATGLCTGPNTCGQVTPQSPTNDLTRLTNPLVLPSGANTLDSISGFRGWRDTTFLRKTAAGTDTTITANGLVDQEEFITIPGSLLGKSLTAQAIFDGKFVSPAPPVAPDYFLIPADNQVTVMWQPSLTETAGDPYFTAASSPANYDPNYRQLDIAGYRVYRGTRGDAASLRLLVQFDTHGDTWVDRTGQINSINAQGTTTCDPTTGVFVSCTSAGPVNGVATIVPKTILLDGPVTQNVVTATTAAAGNTSAVVQKADTALTGGGTGIPGLNGGGTPFIFVDKTGNCQACGVRNHTRYYYMVSAFDINSIRSGPSSQESNLNGAKAIIPVPSPSNISSSGTVQPVELLDQNGTVLTDNADPTLDPTTGRFSKPFPPANGATAALKAFLPEVLPPSGGVTLKLVKLKLGSSYNNPAVPTTYTWQVISGSSTDTLITSITQDATDVTNTSAGLFEAVPLDSAAAAKYGGSNQFKLLGQLDQTLVGSYYSAAFGRGCVNGADGFVPAAGQAGCDYNGSRWFLGPSPTTNETKADPIAGNGDNLNPGVVDSAQAGNAGWNNAGELPNVQVIHQPYSYQTMGNQWRDVEGVLSAARRAADYNVYWSATTPGLIDRVEDVTHGVDVPFKADTVGATYGLLTSALAQPSGVGQGFDQRAELSLTDFGCVEPLRSYGSAANSGPQNRINCGPTPNAPGDGPTYTLTQQAAIGPIVHFTGSPADSRTSTKTGQGFAMYIVGNLFMFQTTTLPTGTVWSLRDYVGAITGGNGFGGNDGPYAFFPVVRPFAAVGASLRLGFTATTTVASAKDSDLKQVHTVPDPYYVTNSFEASSDAKIIKFVNLPDRAIIRIYTVSGVLVRLLEHNSTISSEAVWDVRNRNGQFVASGVYFYHIEALDARRVGRMTIVNFAK